MKNHSSGAGGAGSCGISPDSRYLTDVYQTHDRPPVTQLVDAATGKVLAQLAASNMTKYEQAGFKKAEQFTYKAADGATTLYGQISFPSNFDPSKKYPTLVPVYGGRCSSAACQLKILPGRMRTASTASWWSTSVIGGCRAWASGQRMRFT